MGCVYQHRIFDRKEDTMALSPSVETEALRLIVKIAGERASSHMVACTLLDRIGEVASKALQSVAPEKPPEQIMLPMKATQKKFVKLSYLMAYTLDIMHSHGRLVRWPGGFWTYPNCPPKPETDGWKNPHAVPRWYVEIGTLKALEKRGFIMLQKVAHRYPEVAVLLEEA